MRTYLRLLEFARPYSRFIPHYFATALLATLLSVANFALIIPMLEVLFGKVPEEDIVKVVPDFSFTIGYVKDLFYFHFFKVMQESGEVQALFFICAFLVAAAFGKNIFRYLSQVVLAKARARIIKNLRDTLYDHIVGLHLGYFSENKKGDLISRATNDVQEIENSLINSVTVVLRDPFTIIAYFAMLMIISAKLTLFTLILLPVSALVIGYITKKLRKHTGRMQHELGNVLGNIEETISGIKVIKAFNAQHILRDRFFQITYRYSRSLKDAAYRRDLASPASEFMGIVVVTGILYYGGLMVLSEGSELSAAEFIAYLGVFSQILVPAKAIAGAFGNIQRGLIAGERIFEILETPAAVVEPEQAVVLDRFEGEVAFEEVSFAYEQGQPVLYRLSFKLPKGKTVALVGPSGGGKSTIADLIPRFYDPVSGRITIDGHDLRQLELRSLRGLMSVVTQESLLFDDTIFNNIAFGITAATQEAVERAAKVANAHDFILQQELGYQTVIGDRGVKLSGGQKQRISIARAVLKNPDILILDEATSALDTESEKLVQEALTNLLKGRTSLVIAHRLSTILHADEILVVDGGKIVERGSHQALVQVENGLYKKLSAMQHL